MKVLKVLSLITLSILVLGQGAQAHYGSDETQVDDQRPAGNFQIDIPKEEAANEAETSNQKVALKQGFCSPNMESTGLFTFTCSFLGSPNHGRDYSSIGLCLAACVK